MAICLRCSSLFTGLWFGIVVRDMSLTKTLILGDVWKLSIHHRFPLPVDGLPRSLPGNQSPSAPGKPLRDRQPGHVLSIKNTCNK
ncbi:hypothetical protein HHUSO_G33952 [Huso huso]|uniref:Secreted protein n=1 Tax=Huso huso TaxID=61971 RepID=A0ABR0Y6I2_HUSHU